MNWSLPLGGCQHGDCWSVGCWRSRLWPGRSNRNDAPGKKRCGTSASRSSPSSPSGCRGFLFHRHRSSNNGNRQWSSRPVQHAAAAADFKFALLPAMTHLRRWRNAHYAARGLHKPLVANDGRFHAPCPPYSCLWHGIRCKLMPCQLVRIGRTCGVSSISPLNGRKFRLLPRFGLRFLAAFYCDCAKVFDHWRAVKCLHYFNRDSSRMSSISMNLFARWHSECLLVTHLPRCDPEYANELDIPSAKLSPSFPQVFNAIVSRWAGGRTDGRGWGWGWGLEPLIAPAYSLAYRAPNNRFSGSLRGYVWKSRGMTLTPAPTRLGQ